MRLGEELILLESHGVESLYADIMDGVLIMTVNPEFAGQKTDTGNFG